MRFSVAPDGRVRGVNQLAKAIVSYRRRAQPATLPVGNSWLISLHLRSAWRWPITSAAIGLTLPASIGAFVTVEAQLGWPSHAVMPANFQLNAALVNEPSAEASDDGVRSNSG